MKYTANYNLKKPDGTDIVDIGDLNDNADIIDTELKKAANHIANRSNPHGVTASQVGAAPSSHVGSRGSAHGVATTSTAGFMSADDKSKLDKLSVRHLYVGDDTVKTVYGSSASTIKAHRLVCSRESGFNIKAIHVIAEIYRTGSGTGYLDVYVDGSRLFTLSTTSSSYQLVQGGANVSFANNTVHEVEIRLRHSSSSYRVYNRLYECYVEVG